MKKAMISLAVMLAASGAVMAKPVAVGRSECITTQSKAELPKPFKVARNCYEQVVCTPAAGCRPVTFCD